MAKNMSVSLGDHFAEFIEHQIAHGRYSSASDVVRAGLRLLEDQETGLASLHAALLEGDQSGQSTPLDLEAFVSRKRTKP